MVLPFLLSLIISGAILAKKYKTTTVQTTMKLLNFLQIAKLNTIIEKGFFFNSKNPLRRVQL